MQHIFGKELGERYATRYGIACARCAESLEIEMNAPKAYAIEAVAMEALSEFARQIGWRVFGVPAHRRVFCDSPICVAAAELFFTTGRAAMSREGAADRATRVLAGEFDGSAIGATQVKYALARDVLALLADARITAREALAAGFLVTPDEIDPDTGEVR